MIEFLSKFFKKTKEVEVQYCEDCEHFVPDEVGGYVDFSQCKKNKLRYIRKDDVRELEYCKLIRTHETCKYYEEKFKG